ncbi:MAG: XTP/dITP diphosphatase [Actinobacteria bacterium]|nr:XTP/dITP diphosphatase [Actinomycetota bacterium]
MSHARLALATGNRGKAREIAEVLDGLELDILTRDDFDEWPDLEETGKTFEENAVAKALELSRWSGLPALADDSGLEVEALGGAPGVDSAIYAGTHGNDAANVARLLRELEGIPQRERGARFVCVLALASPAGDTVLVRETCEGAVSEAPRGDKGFGYDPVFIPAGMSRTMAELTLEEKNAVSHRGKALRRLRALLEAGEPAWLFSR